MNGKRLATWWVRWNDLNWPNRDNEDRIKQRAEKMAKANITSAVIFGTHFRWDYLPFFTMLHDYLATVAQALHAYGIELIDHHSVNLVHRYNTKEEMRHVMLHSGPHLPFCPSSEAAATWQYKGKSLNHWRMIDVKTNDILYFPQYAAEGFCHRNPEFVEAYIDYAKRLIADTGIDGLMADDTVHYMHYNSCGCAYCRQELKNRAGIDLPPMEDQSFWGNWDNPAWKHWLDLRLDACGDFQQKLAQALPEGFQLMSCGASSAAPGALEMGSDARQFLRGCNYTNLEMTGNTPPYKHDPVTVNHGILHKMVNASHHQAAAREKGVRCYGTGYGFTEPSANIIWAVNKVLGSDCWFSTLKDRLGLADHILASLPDEADAIGNAFSFEASHPELFDGNMIGQLAVYYAYETRNHTCMGNMTTGYYKDYLTTLQALFRAGISTHTVFSFPENTDNYPLILLPSAASMTEQEIAKMHTYLAAGGKIIVTGPSAIAQCQNSWVLPSKPDVTAQEFFSTIRDGVWHKNPKWVSQPIPETTDAYAWTEPVPGLFYNPHRMIEPQVTEDVLTLCQSHCGKLPVNVLQSQGYLITMFQSDKGITVHFLAEDYDTDIDHHLDEIRFHRSRVNFINKVTPAGVCPVIRLKADSVPSVHTPFDRETTTVHQDGDILTVTLPENCAYAIMHFHK